MQIINGKVSDALVDLSDWLPTVCESAGAPVPESLHLRSKSFAPLLRGEPFTGREQIYCWYERNGTRDKASQHTRDRNYKLYADGRFYDVANDFKEERPMDTELLPKKAAAAYKKLKFALGHEMVLTRFADQQIAKRLAELKKDDKKGE